MSFLIKSISPIDPKAIEFSDGDGDDASVVYPSHAYEVYGVLNDEKIETYGVVWIIEGQEEPAAFISEELEEHLIKHHANQFTKSVSDTLTGLIHKKYWKEKISFPVTIWE